MSPSKIYSWSCLVLTLICSKPSGAQNLNPGDIAFTGYQSTSSSDTFCFVVLRPQGINSGTTVNFTDNGWNINNLGNTNEGIISWTVSQNIAYGQQVSIWLGGSKGSPQGTVTTVSGTMSLAAGGDQIFAFQGNWTNNPTLICGLHYNASAQTTSGNWDGTAATVSNTSTSTYPGSLNGYTIWVKDPATSAATKTSNAYYHDLLYREAANMRTYVNDRENWTFSSITSGDPGWRIPFPLVNAVEETLNLDRLSVSELCIGKAFTVYFSSEGNFGANNIFHFILKSVSGESELDIAQSSNSDSIQINTAQLNPDSFYIFVRSTDPVLESSQELILKLRPATALVKGESPQLCYRSGPLPLNFISPTGGSYSGLGVAQNTFTPSSMNPGSYSVSYSYINQFGCLSSTTGNVIINPLPVLQINSVGAICKNSSGFSLSASPAGGAFSGNAVVDGLFYPELATIGANTVEYSFTDGNTCSNKTSTQIEVVDAPEVIFPAIPAICQGESINLQATPPGGRFSGIGVKDGIFHSEGLEPGSYIINYQYLSGNCSNSKEQHIEILPLPEVSLSFNDSICPDSLPANLTAGIPHGGFYSGLYVHENQFYSRHSGSGHFPIEYHFMSENGCSNKAQAILTIRTIPGWQAIDSTSFCQNQEKLTLETVFEHIDNFSGPGMHQGFFDPGLLNPGSYLLNGQYSSNGCRKGSNVVIGISAPPSPVISGPERWTICPGTSTDLKLTKEYEQLSWFFNDELIASNTEEITVSDSGSYQVWVKDTNGCSNTSPSAQLNIFPSSTPQANWKEAPTICLTEATSLNYPCPRKVDWFEGEDLIASNTNYLAVTSSGNYWFRTSDENGCNIHSQAVSLSVLTAPRVFPVDSAALCRGQQVDLQAEHGLIKMWYFDHLETGNNDPHFTATETGWYSALVADKNQCTIESKPFHLRVHELPVPMIELQGNDSLCANETGHLKTGHFAHYNWFWNDRPMVGEKEPGLALSKSGFYHVVVSDSNSCIGRSDDQQMLFFEAKPAILDKDGANFSCSNSSFELNCLNCDDLQFDWFLNDDAIDNPHTSYTTDLGGNIRIRTREWQCESWSKTTIIIKTPEPEQPSVLYEGGSLRSSSPENNQWYFNDEAIEGATGQLCQPEKDGKYVVSVSNSFDCENFSEAYWVQGLKIGTNTPEGFLLYPNPAMENLFVEYTEDLLYEIISSDGKIVSKGTSIGPRSVLSLNPLPKGLYEIKWQTTSGDHFQSRIIHY